MSGIINGADITEHNPTPNFTVDVSGPALVYDQLSQKIAWATTQNIDCTIDENGSATAVATSGNEKYLSIFAEYERSLSDPRTDRNGATVFFVRAESYKINVVQGVEAPTGTAVKPALRADQVLLGDVLITYGMTQIQTSDIDLDRAEYPYDITGSPLAIKEKGLQDVLQAMLDQLNTYAIGNATLAGDNVFTGANEFQDTVEFSGSVPISLTPVASPSLSNNGDLAYDSTGDDRLIARINGVDRDVAQAQKSRVILIPMSLGCEGHTAATNEWTFIPYSNVWGSENTDGNDYRMFFPLSGLIPQGSTITQARAQINAHGTSTGTDRLYFALKRDNTDVASGYHSGGSGTEWVTLSSLSISVESQTYEYSVYCRAQLAPITASNNVIYKIEVTFTDGNFARVP